VCCSVLQCGAVCCSLLQLLAHWERLSTLTLQVCGCVAVCRFMLQCVAVCCSMLQCVAVLAKFELHSTLMPVRLCSAPCCRDNHRVAGTITVL